MLTSQILAFTALGMTALAAPSTITLRSDDVVLYGKGRYQIMKRSELEDIEAYRNNGTTPPKPAYLDPNVITTTGASDAVATDKKVRSTKKRWSESTIIIRNPDNRFLGWYVNYRGRTDAQVRSGLGHSDLNRTQTSVTCPNPTSISMPLT